MFYLPQGGLLSCKLFVLLGEDLGSPPREELTSPLCASLEVNWKADRCDFGRFLDVLLEVKR